MTYSSTEVSPVAEIAAARDLLGRHSVVDGHNDLPWALRVADELARGNILRVMREAEAASRAISAQRGPSRARIQDLDG